jgi:hypothetical protein
MDEKGGPTNTVLIPNVACAIGNDVGQPEDPTFLHV